MLNKELIAVQSKLRAPKGQHNKFGNYNYRSAEDILEAVKPLLKENGAQLTLTDSIEQIGNRIYVKALATFESESGVVQASAFAREPEVKKGMDESQITGTASSYARKYALNGLFCIDDQKDPDTDEFHRQTSGERQQDDRPIRTTGNTRQGNGNKPMNYTQRQDRPITVTGDDDSDKPMNSIQRQILENLCHSKGWNPETVFEGWPYLTQKQYGLAAEKLKKMGVTNGDPGQNH